MGSHDKAIRKKAEIMVAPSLQTEGKKLQREQGIGMSR
jgi:hypothetical protein